MWAGTLCPSRQQVGRQAGSGPKGLRLRSSSKLVLTLILLLSIILSGCGVLATTAVVTTVVVVTAASVAVEGGILVDKGVYKTGEVVVDAVKGEEERQR
jgi:hypothetical protein